MSSLGMAAVPLCSATVTAKPGSDDWADNYRELLTERYGSAPANAAVGITRPLRRRRERGEVTQEQYHEQLTEKLLDHPVASVIAEGASQVDRRFRQEQARAKNTSKPDSHTVQSKDEISTSSVSYPALLYTESSQNATGLGTNSINIKNGVDNDPFPDVIKISSAVTYYGSATAQASMYARFKPQNDGNYNIQLEYFRRGSGASGGGNLYLYRRKPNGSINTELIESVSTFVEGKRTVDSTFFLQSGKQYEIGLQVSTAASTIASGSFGDFFDGNRKVVPNETLVVEYLG